MLTIEFFSMIFIRKGKKFVSKQDQSLSLTFTQRLGLLFSIITIMWSILRTKMTKFMRQ